MSVPQVELEVWLSLFDSKAWSLLKDFMYEKAEYHLAESMLKLRNGEVDEAKVHLAMHDVINKVLPDIRSRVQQLKEMGNGSNQ